MPAKQPQRSTSAGQSQPLIGIDESELCPLADALRGSSGIPPKCNANVAWVQHIDHRLAPAGTAGFALANTVITANLDALGFAEGRR